MKVIVSIILAAVLVAGIAGCGGVQVEGVPSTVAEVNGKQIAAGDFLAETSRMAGAPVLQRLIETMIILDWAEDEGVAPTEEQIKARMDMLEREGMLEDREKMLGKDGLRRDIMREIAMANIAIASEDIEINEDELKSNYEAQKDYVYDRVGRKQLLMLVSMNKETIEDAKKRIDDGEDFEEVGEALPSDYGTTGMQKGMILDEYGDNMMAPPDEIVDAVKELEEGEVSEVIESGPPADMPEEQSQSYPTRYFMIKVVKKQPELSLKFEDVKDELEMQVAIRKANSSPVFQEELAERKKEAEIKINIDSLKKVAADIKNPPPPMQNFQMPPQPAPQDSEDNSGEE